MPRPPSGWQPARHSKTRSTPCLGRRNAGVQSGRGVSTDSVAGRHETGEKAKYNDGLPIPLVSDATLATFKSYRAHDDFEAKPLHGTFLIDGDGLIRWQDISYQPFMETKFLLTEAKRLLGLPKSNGAATPTKLAGQTQATRTRIENCR